MFRLTSSITRTLLGVLLLLWLLPYIISWSFIRKDVEQTLLDTIGTPVTIETLRPTLLPWVGAVVKGVNIQEKKSATGNTLLKGHMDELTVKLSWISLLTFKVKANVYIQDTDITLDNHFFSTLKKAEKKPAEKPTSDDPLIATYETMTGLRESIPVLRAIGGRIRLENGNITYTDKANKTTVKNAHLGIEADSMFGAYHLDGSLAFNGTPINTKIVIHRFHPTEILPVNADITFGAINVAIDGSVDPQKQSFKGNIKGGWEEYSTGPSHQPVSFHGTLEGSPKSVDATLKEFKLGPSTGVGRAHFLFKPRLQGGLVLENLPGNTKLQIDLTVRGDRSRGKLSFSSDRTQSFLAAIPGAPTILTTDHPLSVKAILSVNTAKSLLKMKKVDIDFGPAKLDGSVHVDYEKMVISHRLKTPAAGAWIHLFNAQHDPKMPGKINEKGSLTLQGEKITFKEEIDLQPGKVKLDGSFSQGVIDAKYTADIKDLSKTMTNLTGAPTMAGRVLLKGTLKGKPEDLDIQGENLDMDVNGTALKGTTDIHVKNNPKKKPLPQIDATLTIKKLTIGTGTSLAPPPESSEGKADAARKTKEKEVFMKPLPPKKENPAKKKREKEEADKASNEKKKDPAKAGSNGDKAAQEDGKEQKESPEDRAKAIKQRNRNNFPDLPSLPLATNNMITGIPVEGTFKIAVANDADFAGIETKDFAIELAFSPQEISLKKMSGNFAGGTLTGSASLKASGPNNFINVQGTDLSLAQIANGLSGDLLLKGAETQLTVDLKSPRGDNMDQFLAAASGKIILKSRPGAIVSPKLLLACQMVNMLRATSFFTKAGNSIKSGVCEGAPVALTQIALNLELVKGMGTFHNAFFISQLSDGFFAGNIDFTKKNFDLFGDVTLEIISYMPPMPAVLRGTFSNIGHELDKSGLTASLAGTQMAGALGSSIPGLGALVGVATGNTQAGTAVGNVIGSALGGPLGSALLGGLFGAVLDDEETYDEEEEKNDTNKEKKKKGTQQAGAKNVTDPKKKK